MGQSNIQALISSLRMMADDVRDRCGAVANAAVREAASRLEDLHARTEARCVWVQDDDDGEVYDGSCGVRWEFQEGGPRENETNFCPRCGARVDAGRLR